MAACGIIATWLKIKAQEICKIALDCIDAVLLFLEAAVIASPIKMAGDDDRGE